jgi:cell division protease FtsH
VNNLLKNIGIWLVIGLVVLTVVKQFDARQSTKDTVSYSEFMDSAKNGKVESAVIEGRTIKWSGTDKKRFVTTTPGDIWMVSDLLKYGVQVDAKAEEEQSFLAQVFISWFPMLPPDRRVDLLHAPDAGRRAAAARSASARARRACSTRPTTR